MMRDNVRILGVLSIVIGSLGLLAAVGIFAVLGGLAGVAGLAGGRDRDALVGASFLAAVGVGIAVIITLLSLPQIIGGWGLLHFWPWARLLMIVVSILSLFHIPIGTALGVYGIWVLFSDETRRLFLTGGIAAQMTAGYGSPYPAYAPPAPHPSTPLSSYPKAPPSEPPVL